MNQNRIMGFLFSIGIVALLSACDATTEGDGDSFQDLDIVADGTLPNTDSVTVENQFASNIALEMWSGNELEFNPSISQTKGLSLREENTIALAAYETKTFTMDGVKNLLVIAGLEKSNLGEYEYLTHNVFPGMSNGTAIRMTRDGDLESYYASACMKTLADAEISATTAITADLVAMADDVATQWTHVVTAINPLRRVFELAKAILENNNPALTSSLADLASWTYTNTGVYQHTETVNNSTFTLSMNYNWGEDAPGKTAGDPIDKDIHVESNYVTNLSVSISQSNQTITFNYDGTSGSLAPLLGLQAGVAGPQTMSITTWAQDIINQYKTMSMNVILDIGYSTSGKTLSTQLAFQGRPSFAVNYDITDPMAPIISVQENPVLLSLVDSASAEGANSTRGQTLDVSEWTLKVFPSQNGAKGNLTFAATGDANFDFTGYIAYNSDASVDANVFLKCSSDNSPLPY